MIVLIMIELGKMVTSVFHSPGNKNYATHSLTIVSSNQSQAEQCLVHLQPLMSTCSADQLVQGKQGKTITCK